MSHGHDGPGFFASLDFKYLGKMAAGFGVACLIFAILLGVGAAAGLNNGVLRPIFAPFGLAGTPAPSPLQILDVTAKAEQDAAGQPVLNITGRVHNDGHFTAKIPTIEITLLS